MTHSRSSTSTFYKTASNGHIRSQDWTFARRNAADPSGEVLCINRFLPMENPKVSVVCAPANPPFRPEFSRRAASLSHVGLGKDVPPSRSNGAVLIRCLYLMQAPSPRCWVTEHGRLAAGSTNGSVMPLEPLQLGAPLLASISSRTMAALDITVGWMAGSADYCHFETSRLKRTFLGASFAIHDGFLVEELAVLTDLRILPNNAEKEKYLQ
ncbi:uncharacterized protein BKA78DRAFT_328227 [Phyllosticta capitalensis]|uniref:uncharacterized protein n=1 Tax=Phyllosticta capitalensis TaxID=121624 RepID=UPI00312FEDF3